MTGRFGGGAVPSDRPGRVIGVDVARGIALFGMMAVHVFATFAATAHPRSRQCSRGDGLECMPRGFR
ncbi:MAG: hypothetical protein DLM61_23640 [Pseudonocardiales bacterium]|nr:MAG: hypothetical protein DLM61_23640 [Pseudonocardiales bacterium]